MQKKLPSQQKGLRPIPVVTARMQDLDRRYGRMCAYFRLKQGPSIEKVSQFVSLALSISKEYCSLESELEMSKAAIGEMRAKRAEFEKYIGSGISQRNAAREGFVQKYGCTPEACFHEFHILAEEIIRLEGERPGMKQKIRSFFSKQK
ncbi:MAG: hypothetical protein WC506_02300 [Candidatus Micrarchaeia archaeon]